jgi:hypothetical protein
MITFARTSRVAAVGQPGVLGLMQSDPPPEPFPIEPVPIDPGPIVPEPNPGPIVPDPIIPGPPDPLGDPSPIEPLGLGTGVGLTNSS